MYTDYEIELPDRIFWKGHNGEEKFRFVGSVNLLHYFKQIGSRKQSFGCIRYYNKNFCKDLTFNDMSTISLFRQVNLISRLYGGYHKLFGYRFDISFTDKSIYRNVTFNNVFIQSLP